MIRFFFTFGKARLRPFALVLAMALALPTNASLARNRSVSALKAIYIELAQAPRDAIRDTAAGMLVKGDNVALTRPTPLSPKKVYHEDPSKAVTEFTLLEKGEAVEILKTGRRTNKVSYYVIVKSTKQKGWIDNVDLEGQYKKIKPKDNERARVMAADYLEEVREKHGLSEEEYNSVRSQGMKNNWPSR